MSGFPKGGSGPPTTFANPSSMGLPNIVWLCSSGRHFVYTRAPGRPIECGMRLQSDPLMTAQFCRHSLEKADADLQAVFDLGGHEALVAYFAQTRKP